MILLCCIWSWHGFNGYRCSWILRNGGNANFSWIREVFFGIVDGFSRKFEGYSLDMDLRGDFSYISLGWRLRYLDENSHSPLLVYLEIFYLRGIVHCIFEVYFIYDFFSWIWILSYGT